MYVGLETGTQTITSVRFASNDGKLFDLNGIDLGYDSWQGASATSFTFTGYLDGAPVSGATYTTAAVASFGNSGTWQRGINFTANINFQGIDEFRIVSSSAVLTALDIDNINATNFRNPNSAPTFSGLNGGNTFLKNGSAVVVDSNVTVADSELDALNSDNGNYSGASITIARNGGANS